MIRVLCSLCRGKAIALRISTAATPKGVLVVSCARCDRASCHKCRAKLPPSARQCSSCWWPVPALDPDRLGRELNGWE